ncbi:MAG: permease-like cell division protein FtsX [Ignavibacteriae bacterium]|nr:permease-like cell division protein FtsX [Ignavibacteriota bacterium]
MKFGYLYKEAIRGFANAKLSAFASVITITLSLILIAIYFLFTVNSNRIIKNIKDKVEIEVFLIDDIKTDELNTLKEKLKAVGGVKNIVYVSKDDAAKIFSEEFGSDMLDIYDYNPLPASYKINLYDEYKTIDRINRIKAQITNLPQISDVQFPEKNLELIESKTTGFLFINLIIMVVITISSIFLVSNTIRLIISSRSKIIETFKLLGAKRSFIMIPFLIEGFIQGLAGSILAISALYLFFTVFVSKFESTDLHFELLGTDIVLYVVLIGVTLGIAGSYFSVLKYLKVQN